MGTLRSGVTIVRVKSCPLVAMVRRPPEIEIIRRAYELWELSGKPEGRDQDFYLQALQELQTTLDDQAPDQPE
jgi:DUF2934 family protein